MSKEPYLPTLYLIRHATPDWSRKDIPYDIPPGPPLTIKGQQEAQALGIFLEKAGIKKLYYSPLERSEHTAKIVASVSNVPIVEQAGLAELRTGEVESEIHARLWPVLEASVAESAQLGPLGLVTHGGLVSHLLKRLGLTHERFEEHLKMFDHANPMPPAGVWIAQKNTNDQTWNLELVFTPPE